MRRYCLVFMAKNANMKICFKISPRAYAWFAVSHREPSTVISTKRPKGAHGEIFMPPCVRTAAGVPLHDISIFISD